jgi:hypothetical protein
VTSSELVLKSNTPFRIMDELPRGTAAISGKDTPLPCFGLSVNEKLLPPIVRIMTA